MRKFIEYLASDRELSATERVIAIELYDMFMYGNDVTLSKLCKALAWSVSTISAALDRLRDKGVINKNGFKFTTEYLKKGSDDE